MVGLIGAADAARESGFDVSIKHVVSYVCHDLVYRPDLPAAFYGTADLT